MSETPQTLSAREMRKLLDELEELCAKERPETEEGIEGAMVALLSYIRFLEEKLSCDPPLPPGSQPHKER